MRGMRGGYYGGGGRYGPPRMPQPYGHYGGGGGGHNRHRMALPYNSFEITSQSEPGFQRVYPVPDEKLLTEALLQRNQDLTPSAQDQASVSALLTKVVSILETLVLNPAAFEPAQIEEVKQVGSFKKCTIMAGQNVADIVIVFRTLPTKEAVNALANKILADYRNTNRTEWVMPTLTAAGFDVATRQATLRCLVATIPGNMRLLDENVHTPTRELVQTHLAAIRHVKWFDENANNTSVRALVRILRDMRNRFSGLTSLNSWMIELLAHHAINNRSAETPLALAPAFRRCLQLLAGGIFLPGAAGIIDPCEPQPLSGYNTTSVHDSLTFEEMDRICFTAQSLLRVNSHGGARHVLGIEGNSSIATDMSVWGHIIVTASEAAFDRSEAERWDQEDAAAHAAAVAAAESTEEIAKDEAIPAAAAAAPAESSDEPAMNADPLI